MSSHIYKQLEVSLKTMPQFNLHVNASSLVIQYLLIDELFNVSNALPGVQTFQKTYTKVYTLSLNNQTPITTDKHD
jgi:hypothetical protein